MIGVKLQGANQVHAAVKGYSQSLRKAHDKALYEEGLELMRESMKEVPVDTGRLRNSAHTSKPRGGDVEVSYEASYAPHVHWRTDLKHAVGKARFLIDPFLRRMDGYPKRMRDRIARHMGRV